MASPLERTFRITTLISSVFSLPILIPASIISEQHNYDWRTRWGPSNGYNRQDAVLGFAFIPLVFTVCTSIVYLARDRMRKAREASPAPSLASYPVLWVITDFMIFSGYVVALVFEWVEGMDRLHSAPDHAFLEAYATVPLMLNLTLHVLMIFINIKMAFRSLRARAVGTARECPHCHHTVRVGCDEVAQKGSGEDYSLLRGEEYDDDAGRASSSSEDRVALPAVEEV